MQRLYQFPPDADLAVEVDPGELARLVDGPGWLWLDVAGFTAREVQELAARFDFDAITVEEVLARVRYPKVEEHEQYTFVVGHGLSIVAEERLETTEVDVFISDGFLVTVHAEDLPGVEFARDQVVSSAGFAATPDVLWARISEAGAARFRPLLEGLEDRLDDLEEGAIRAEPSVPVEVLALRRDVQTLRQVVNAQRDALRMLAREHHVGVTKNGSRRISHVSDDFGRLAEELEGARAHLGNLLDTYRSTVAERANEVMKVLTVFAAIVLPLSLLAGIYGMNFANMPELDWRWGYFGLLGVMGIVALGLWVYFARRGFIGGPRVGAVPGLVGRGLVGIVKLTAKPATLLIDLARSSGEGHPSDDG